jgi:hypothetical protein
MAVIPRLIDRYAIILYVLGALGVFLYIWTAVQARRKQGLALFSLERENAADQSRRSWLMAGICVLLVAGVYGVSNYVVPNLPQEEVQEPQKLAALLFTPTPSPTVPPPPTATRAPTVTPASLPTVSPVATPVPQAPDPSTSTEEEQEGAGGLAPACTSAGTQILAPNNGDHLSGSVEVLGTASLPDFSFYKFEIRWPGTEEWVTLQSFNQPVAGGLLGIWDTAPLVGQPGTYGFRLVVVDQTGNFPEPCEISVTIE